MREGSEGNVKKRRRGSEGKYLIKAKAKKGKGGLDNPRTRAKTKREMNGRYSYGTAPKVVGKGRQVVVTIEMKGLRSLESKPR